MHAHTADEGLQFHHAPPSQLALHEEDGQRAAARRGGFTLGGGFNMGRAATNNATCCGGRERELGPYKGAELVHSLPCARAVAKATESSEWIGQRAAARQAAVGITRRAAAGAINGGAERCKAIAQRGGGGQQATSQSPCVRDAVASRC